jgi:hypothetical protein
LNPKFGSSVAGLNTPKAFADFSQFELAEIVGQFQPVEITPKALANFSPGLERSDNPGYTDNGTIKP